MSDCGEYVICSISEGCEPVNRVYVCRLKSLEGEIKGGWCGVLVDGVMGCCGGMVCLWVVGGVVVVVWLVWLW